MNSELGYTESHMKAFSTLHSAAAAAGASSAALPRRLPTTRMSAAAAAAAAEANGNSDHKTVNVNIKGKVQGVFYRNWTVETAKQLGLNGWVRNRRDGSVEAVFSGKASSVDSMIHKCNHGPPAAKVSGLEVSAWSGGAIQDGFDQKPTE